MRTEKTEQPQPETATQIIERVIDLTLINSKLNDLGAMISELHEKVIGKE